MDLDPLLQFQAWQRAALNSGDADANAMVLATASKNARPSARVVLYKGLKDEGIVFYTNYESRKGVELTENPFGALVFHWSGQGRQVRMEGAIEKLSSSDSDAYWQTRPRESQLSALISKQSRVIPDFESLVDALEKAGLGYMGKRIPRPRHWGGFRLLPDKIEFWSESLSRLHHRLRYRRAHESRGHPARWISEILAP